MAADLKNWFYTGKSRFRIERHGDILYLVGGFGKQQATDAEIYFHDRADEAAAALRAEREARRAAEQRAERALREHEANWRYSSKYDDIHYDAMKQRAERLAGLLKEAREDVRFVMNTMNSDGAEELLARIDAELKP